MSRRGIFLGVVVVCAVLGLAIWGGSLLGKAGARQQAVSAQTQLAVARSEVAEVKSDFAVMQHDNNALRTQLVSSENALSQFQSSYTAMQMDNISLRAQLTTSETVLSQMKTTDTALQEQNARLLSQLASLNSEYESLKARYQALENTKQFTVDGRLRVSMSTELQFATSATWVRGTVTNIGGSAIQKVYVLVSRYKPDGSLDRIDLPPSIIAGMAPGATGNFSFVATGESYKVTVIGDY